jgi:extracellular elastinolytic metalloproteinase
MDKAFSPGVCRGALLVLLALASVAVLPSTAHAVVGIPEISSQHLLPDVDARAGSVAPTAAQLQAVQQLGAHASWNRFGTPQSLIKYGGFLATGLGSDPVAAARQFISDNQALFRLSAAGVSNLELLNDSPLVGSAGHAVLFRQRFGGLAATQDGLITVGVVNGNVSYVSSTSAGVGNAPSGFSVSPDEAFVAAAANVGRNVSVVNITRDRVDSRTGWNVLTVNGFPTWQRVRQVAFPTYTQGVRPAYEVLVFDPKPVATLGVQTYIDGQTGAVLFRHNGVQNAVSRTDSSADVFMGTYTFPACGPRHGPYAAGAGTQSIDEAASAELPANDIVLYLRFGATAATSVVVASQDTATSPEALHYAPGGGVPPGNYWAEVCPFDAAQTPPANTPYNGTIVINDSTPPISLGPTPKWKYFTANPLLNTQPSYPWGNPDTDIRIIGCWLDTLSNPAPADVECQRAEKNLASRVPWDYNPKTNSPTFTSFGNNAATAEAWVDAFTPLTGNLGPGPTQQNPMHSDRRYVDTWANNWFESTNPAPTEAGKKGCSETQLVPNGNDILAAVTNLFSGHNRMHDWSYRLGFTETNSNLQIDNFGNTAPGPFPNGRELDPEQGNVQAGALNGGPPEFGGRDNANQLTLNDGTPGITNQYLFEPIAAAFYVPCADGDLDTSIFAHEYTHAISNRMVAGPDSGLTGQQAGSMGESWSDLDAMEYQFEYGYRPDPGVSQYVIGPYATGNRTLGIRDYSIDNNPLNFSDVGFDTPGPEVHADGEIWNGTQFEVRQQLINKYNAGFPASDQALQIRCADGILPPDFCPGNRRWIQLVYDAWLLLGPSPSMLDARDAMLAADVTRFNGANQTELWRAFARRAMGQNAVSNGTEDTDPTPGFASPNEPNVAVTFNPVDALTAAAIANAVIYVGDYERGVTPIADTDAGTTRPNTASFVPGTYRILVRAPGYGLVRLQPALSGSTLTLTIQMARNLASTSSGATVVAAVSDGTNPANLLDDTEGTDWQATKAPNVQGTKVTVDLPGSASQTIGSLRLSAMSSFPVPAAPYCTRFCALRSFTVYACVAAVANANCTNPAVGSGTGWSLAFTSPANAFPGEPPRPVAPNLILRTFTLPASVTATHLRLIVQANQCSGGPGFQGDQDADPLNNADCSVNAAAQTVHAAEFEAFAPGAPTAVQVNGFTARRAKAGVAVSWRAASEAGVLGYSVWRIRAGHAVKIQRALIPAKHAASAFGARYRLVDRTARHGVAYSYHLQMTLQNTTRVWVARTNLRATR